MFTCENLLHPFQNDPGTSQRQRVIDSLLSDTVKIDGRSLAGLLDYFSKLSSGINYYDKALLKSDWQPFFTGSLPFTLASISNYDVKTISDKFSFYTTLFNKTPSAAALQLATHFIYQYSINRIYCWYQEVSAHESPLKATILEIIRSKISTPFKEFIRYANLASRWYCVKKIDFTKFLDTAEDDAWDLQLSDLYVSDPAFPDPAAGDCENLTTLFKNISGLFSTFIEALKLMAVPAEENIADSLVPLKQELRQQHPPHLAIIFAFIRLFQKMQDELNKKTKEHLKYFYSEVLKIVPREAEPDRANIVFEVQKILQDRYQKYKVAGKTMLNGGRDKNNADIIFETDGEIIVNETQVAEVRTLYLKNENVVDRTFLEGVYMAPNAQKADGLEKDFNDTDPKNWYTTGNKLSKYKDPETRLIRPYPSARVGFVLASPVLYLAEGNRKVDITINCLLNDSVCKDIQASCGTNPENDCPEYDDIYSSVNLFDHVKDFLWNTVKNEIIPYIVLSDEVLAEAGTKGMSKTSVQAIRDEFLLIPGAINTCTGVREYADFVTATFDDWDTFINTPVNAGVKKETDALPDLFKKRYPFSISFSGENEWIEPSSVTNLQLVKGAGNQFQFLLSVTLGADKPAVTFYNKENLGEELGTEWPLVKIILDDTLKLKFFISDIIPDCCLEKIPVEREHYVSLYHFFRNATVDAGTHIDVKVCGIKNFIVQNDENVMDVNAPVLPFGTRPDIPDFDIINNNFGPFPNAKGPDFYIGSKEILCKKWSKIQVNINWKDKPLNFNDYYKGYLRRKKVPAVPPPNDYFFGLNEADFEYRLAVLQDGVWIDKGGNDKLFPVPPNPAQLLCDHKTGNPPAPVYAYAVIIDAALIPLPQQEFRIDNRPFGKLDVSTRNGFIKLNLRGQDFGHKDYPFILARQMMAFGKLPDGHVEGAVYFDPVLNSPIVISTTDMLNAIKDSGPISDRVNSDVGLINGKAGGIGHNITLAESNSIRSVLRDPNTPNPGDLSLVAGASQLKTNIKTNVIDVLDKLKAYQAIIPNEPWTPAISNIELDYTASAGMDDMSLIHLYPFANTYKQEELKLEPALFPTFCDEGTLYIGLKDYQPGANLNILFQLAEATSDSETNQEKVHWHYLDSNTWKPLRTGFEILQDGTFNLTTTGIIKYALPENITLENTVMPPALHWIKAAVAKNSKSVSEIISLYTQAISATFIKGDKNDTSRLNTPLEPESISKLLVADPAIKTVSQPFESYGGRLPEMEGSYYVRVSELLRHKGRAIQKWDYERLVLEKFPQIFKAKCINHSFHTDAHKYKNDIPVAPGYIILALIPDLVKMNAGNSYEPKVPVSVLEKVKDYFKKINSPFVRLEAANPRYEQVDFCITVRLNKEMDKNFYKEKLKTDLREFLAPWAVGKYEKLSFGQPVYRSDIIGFMEQTGYVDFVRGLGMTHEKDRADLAYNPYVVAKVVPVSPRSILIAGTVDVLIDEDACEQWCQITKDKVDCAGPEPVSAYCTEKNDNVIMV